MDKVKLTSELFKEFTESVLLEHKNNKKMYDECIDIYSKTQFFDLSNVNLEAIIEKLNDNEQKCELLDKSKTQITYNNLTMNLPFESLFIKNNFFNIFIREFNQTTITGCYIRSIKDNYIYKQPFTITYLFNQMIINFDTNNLLSNIHQIFKEKTHGVYIDFLICMKHDIYAIIKVFEKLNKKTILIDEPMQNKATYYRYKDKSKGSLKVNTRPIYIVLDADKKAKKIKYDNISRQGILRRDFSFPVIGHWRKLTDNRHLGKDRQGNYNIQGYTWVNAFIKGNKEKSLIRKERIVL